VHGHSHEEEGCVRIRKKEKAFLEYVSSKKNVLRMYLSFSLLSINSPLFILLLSS
jgi:hypothetical protein